MFDNKVMDAAFGGKRMLTDDQWDAFENGRRLACWFVIATAIATLKNNDLSDFTAECLNTNPEFFDHLIRTIKTTDSDLHEAINLDRKVAEDGFDRTLKIVRDALTA